MYKMSIFEKVTAFVKWQKFVLAAIVVVVSAVSATQAKTASDRKAIVTEPPPPDVIIEWHQEAVRLTVLPSSALAPVQQTRAMAIVQVSVHDAVNGLTREYETYLPPLPAPPGASPRAAAIAAAHHALRTLFPAHIASLDNLFLTSLAAHGLLINDPGVGYGQTAAARILAARANDGAALAVNNSYVAPGAGLPGIFVPLPGQFPLLPGWGNVQPWVLRSASQFPIEPPPALNSEQYTRDYNEIKIIGAVNSPTRTALQTQIATFWLGSPVEIWSQPLAQLSIQNNLNLSQKARVFALTYMSSADAGIACWEFKYEYNYWRPQPAIRRGNEDGNDLTTIDPTWTPLFPTPRHPEYPSGHTTVSTGMASILQMAFGDRPGSPITSTVIPAPPVPQIPITRQWDTFSQGLDEVIDARVFSGIHFRTADVVGSRLGGQVAQFVLTHALRPCRGNGARCS